MTPSPVAQEKRVRVFTLGSAVAEDAVEKLATENRRCLRTGISSTEDMSVTCIVRHFNRMRQPQMEQSRYPLVETSLVGFPQPERACFAGDVYTVFAAFEEEPEGAVGVSFALLASRKAPSRFL